MNVAEARALFPAATRSPYFATNGYGLLPTIARDAMITALERLADRGYGAHARYEHAVDGVRAQVAAFVGAAPDEIGFVRNTADGLGFAAESLPIGTAGTAGTAGTVGHERDEVVVFAGDYGSVVYPFLARQRRGELRVRIVDVPLDGVITAESVAAAIGPRTRAVALSWVRFDSGARSDVAAIAAVCRSRGVWSIVDAIQGLGVFPLDVGAAGIDVLAAGCHKWLCGLAGLGVLYVRAERLAELRPTRAGLDAFDHPDDYLTAGYPWELRPVAARVEDGAKPEVAIAGLGASLEVLAGIGLEAVAAQVRAVTDRLCAGFTAAGGQVRSPRGETAWSGILALEPPPGLDAGALAAAVLADRIVLGVRDGALWLGAHCYTDLTDADRLLSHL